MPLVHTRWLAAALAALALSAAWEQRLEWRG
jgi:hypothetical protein